MPRVTADAPVLEPPAPHAADEPPPDRPVSPTVTIVIPAFNEAQAIAQVTADLRDRYPDHEILVVDDGSSDDTAGQVDRDRVTLVRHERNRGYGASWKTAARRATGDVLVFYDGDGQFNPADVGRLMQQMHRERADAVLGWRQRGSHQPLSRRPGKLVLGWFVRYLTRTRIPDFNCGLRAIRREVLLRYLHLLPDGFSASTTSTIALLKRGYRVAWLPITVQPRIGKSSVRQVRDGLGTMMLIIRLVALFDPLRIFLPTAIVLMVVSLIYSVYEAIRWGLGVPVAGATVFIGGMLCFFLGIICDQVSALRLERFENPFTRDPS
jgi:glycosyltransferase involved in cell wall biosynthesis